jgi:hypothetical protein
MQTLRALIWSVGVLAMIATGIAIGMSRGAMAAEGQLCSVTGPTPVVIAHDGLPLFDTKGQPVTLDRAICLDCVVVGFALPPASLGPLVQNAVAAIAYRPAPPTSWTSAAQPGGQARAPPALG